MVRCVASEEGERANDDDVYLIFGGSIISAIHPANLACCCGRVWSTLREQLRDNFLESWNLGA